MRQEVANFVDREGTPGDRRGHMERAQALERIALQVSTPRAPGEKGGKGIAIMFERLTTPPLARSLLDEAFDTWENIDTVSQELKMQVSLPPGELGRPLALMLRCPGASPASALKRPPSQIFFDYLTDRSGKHRTLRIKTRANPEPDLRISNLELLGCSKHFPFCRSRGDGEEGPTSLRIFIPALPRA
jgi:hypothetical protein